jgi:hypothetical protein
MYKKLKKLLSTRQHVLVESVRGFAVVSMDYLGSAMIRTMFCDSIDMAKTDIALSDVDENECNNWQIIDVFDTPKERFKVGDEVVVTEGKNKGEKGIIDFLCEGYSVRFNDKPDEVYNHNQLSYPFKEAEKENAELFRVNDEHPYFKIIDKRRKKRFPYEELEFEDENGKKYKLKEIK